MKLGEFIKRFSHNNLIRLHYPIRGGQTLVLKDWDDVSMDWEVNKKKGVYKKYINNEVLSLVGIYFGGVKGAYPEAINIVIDRLEEQPIPRKPKKERTNLKDEGTN